MQIFSQQGSSCWGDRSSATIRHPLVRSLGFVLLGWGVLPIAAGRRPALPGACSPAPRPICRSRCLAIRASASAFALQSRQPGGHAARPPGRPHLTQQGYALTGLLAASLFALLRCWYRCCPNARWPTRRARAAPSCASGGICASAPLHGFTLLAGSYRDPVPPALSGPAPHIQSLPDATRLLGGVFTLSAVIGVLLSSQHRAWWSAVLGCRSPWGSA